MIYATLPKSLKAVCDKAALMGFDHHLIVGYRDAATQAAKFKAGLSKAKPGQSPHNVKPPKGPLAFDFVFFPFVPRKGETDPWKDIPTFRAYGHGFVAAGHLIGIDLAWGGDWDSDGDETDQTLFDADHIELKNWRGI